MSTQSEPRQQGSAEIVDLTRVNLGHTVGMPMDPNLFSNEDMAECAHDASGSVVADPPRPVRVCSGYMAKVAMKEACEHVLLNCWEALVHRRQEFKKLSKTNKLNDNNHDHQDDNCCVQNSGCTARREAPARQLESDVATDLANQKTGCTSVKRIQVDMNKPLARRKHKSDTLHLGKGPAQGPIYAPFLKINPTVRAKKRRWLLLVTGLSLLGSEFYKRGGAKLLRSNINIRSLGRLVSVVSNKLEETTSYALARLRKFKLFVMESVPGLKHARSNSTETEDELKHRACTMEDNLPHSSTSRPFPDENKDAPSDGRLASPRTSSPDRTSREGAGSMVDAACGAWPEEPRLHSQYRSTQGQTPSSVADTRALHVTTPEKFEARLVRMLHAEEFDRSIIQRPLVDSRPKRLVDGETSALQAQIHELQSKAAAELASAVSAERAAAQHKLRVAEAAAAVRLIEATQSLEQKMSSLEADMEEARVQATAEKTQLKQRIAQLEQAAVAGEAENLELVKRRMFEAESDNSALKALVKKLQRQVQTLEEERNQMNEIVKDSGRELDKAKSCISSLKAKLDLDSKERQREREDFEMQRAAAEATWETKLLQAEAVHIAEKEVYKDKLFQALSKLAPSGEGHACTPSIHQTKHHAVQGSLNTPIARSASSPNPQSFSSWDPVTLGQFYWDNASHMLEDLQQQLSLKTADHMETVQDRNRGGKVNEEEGDSGAIGRVQEVRGSQQICFTFPNIKSLDAKRSGVKSLGDASQDIMTNTNTTEVVDNKSVKQPEAATSFSMGGLRSV